MIAVRRCGVTVARVGVARLHRHLRPPPSALVAFELTACGWPVGWAMVGRPVSRVLDAAGWVEVTRVAVPSPVDGGPRNGCSALYGAAARWARREGRPVLTYLPTRSSGRATRWRARRDHGRPLGRMAVRPVSTHPAPRRAAPLSSTRVVRWSPPWCASGEVSP